MRSVSKYLKFFDGPKSANALRKDSPGSKLPYSTLRRILGDVPVEVLSPAAFQSFGGSPVLAENAGGLILPETSSGLLSVTSKTWSKRRTVFSNLNLFPIGNSGIDRSTVLF